MSFLLPSLLASCADSLALPWSDGGTESASENMVVARKQHEWETGSSCLGTPPPLRFSRTLAFRTTDPGPRDRAGCDCTDAQTDPQDCSEAPLPISAPAAAGMFSQRGGRDPQAGGPTLSLHPVRSLTFPPPPTGTLLTAILS